MIKERDHPFGVWQLHSKEGQHAIKVTGPLSSNHGEIVHQWCLDGQGIALRSWWDVSEKYRQRPSGTRAAGLLSARQRLGGLRVAAGDLSQKFAPPWSFCATIFQQHYPQQYIVSSEEKQPATSAAGGGRYRRVTLCRIVSAREN